MHEYREDNFGLEDKIFRASLRRFNKIIMLVSSPTKLSGNGSKESPRLAPKTA